MNYRPEPYENLVKGAFVMLDALGYKGIWKQHSRTAVLSAMKKFRKSILTNRENCQYEYECFLEDLMPPTHWIMTEMFSFSDSVFIGVWYHFEANCPTHVVKDPDFRSKDCLIRKAINLSRNFIRQALMDEHVHFKFRGVLTYGDFYMNANEGFLLGPAVDEVAALERAADGPFVWLTESALEDFTLSGKESSVIYNVPMKGGNIFKTIVLQPFTEISETQMEGAENDFELLARLLSIPASASSDVIKKARHVHEFYKINTPLLYEKAIKVLSSLNEL